MSKTKILSVSVPRTKTVRNGCQPWKMARNGALREISPEKLGVSVCAGDTLSWVGEHYAEVFDRWKSQAFTVSNEYLEERLNIEYSELCTEPADR